MKIVAPFAGLRAIVAVLSLQRKYQRGLGAAELNLHGQPPPNPPSLSAMCVDINSYQLIAPHRGSQLPPLEQGYVQSASKFSSAQLRCPVTRGTGAVGQCITLVPSMSFVPMEQVRTVPLCYNVSSPMCNQVYRTKSDKSFAAQAHLLAPMEADDRPCEAVLAGD